MMASRRLVSARAAAALAAAVTLSSPAAAQVRGLPFRTVPQSAEPQQLANVFLPAPRALRQRLFRARQAIEQRQYSDAVLELGALLADADQDPQTDASQDYFIGSPEGVEAQRSLKSEAERLLGTLPEQGRELYELQFGADARALLERALAENDARLLAEVTRKYFHTQAGYEAALLLGRRHLDEGRPLAAALCLQRLARARAARERFDPELSVLLAACWLYSGLPDHAEQVLRELKQRRPNLVLSLGGRETPLFERPEDALPWAESLLAAPGLSRKLEQTQWLMHRGAPGRNGRSNGDEPLGRPRWRVPTVNDPLDQELVRQLARGYAAQGVSLLPATQPLAVNGLVLMRTPERLLAVDFRTGKRIWEFPWFDAAEPAEPGDLMALREAGAQRMRMHELEERLWRDAPYGQLSSDGRSAFLLFDLGFAPAYGQRQVLIGPMGRAVVNPRSARSTNRLVSLDLQKEGKLRWIVGGEDGEDEPQTAGVFFLGPPLPLGGSLYVIGERNGEICLYVLDAATGRLQWRQQLAHVDAQTVINDAQRRLAGASPSFADGVLVCPTSAGAVVAVDAATRSLLWGRQYAQRPVSPFRFGPGGWRSTAGSGGAWADATVTIAEGCALLTPVESDYLYCLDLATGDLRWPPLPREDGLYVACVHQGRAVIVGAESVRAVRLSDGTQAWQEAVDLRPAAPSGRGFYSGNRYYLPLNSAELIAIDLDRGRIAARQATDDVLGNLVCYREEVISHGPEWLATYYQRRPLLARVEQRLAANPDDAWALARQGELRLLEGDVRGALDSLRRALRAEPEDAAARSLLLQTLLDALRQDFAAYRQFAAEAERLIDQPAQRAEYLQLAAAGLQQLGQMDQAFQAYLKLADLEAGRGVRVGASELMQEIDAAHRVRRDRWVQARLAELLRQADPEQRRAMDAVIQQRLEAALAAGDVLDLRRFVRHFGAHPAADRARLELARRLREQDDLLEAELLLADLAERSDPAIAGPAEAELARLLAAAGRYDQAAEAYRRLAARYPDQPVLDGQTGRQLMDAARRTDFRLAGALQVGPWPRGPVRWEAEATPMNRFPSYQKVYPIRWAQRRGPMPEGAALAVDQRINAIVLRDGYGGLMLRADASQQRRYYSLNYIATYARACGHLLLLSLGPELVALDAVRPARREGQAVLWRQELLPSSEGLNAPQQVRTRAYTNQWFGVRYVATTALGSPIGHFGPITPHGVCYQRLNELVCVNPVTGETIWARSDAPQGAELFGDDELLFVVAPDDDQAIVLSMLDGAVLGRRPVTPIQQRCATLGRRILASDATEDGRFALRLYDAWEQRDIWRRTFDIRSKACLIGTDEVAVMEPDGRLVILSLADEQPRVETQLEPEPGLERVVVLRSAQRYLVAVSRATPRKPTDPVTITAAPGGVYTPLINGRIYAFDRRTGQPAWDKPLVVDRYGLPPDQPARLPVLVLMRHVTVRQDGRQPTRTALLCVDRRTGRILLAKDDLAMTSGVYEMSGDPRRGVVRVQLPSLALVLTFADQPAGEPATSRSTRRGADGQEGGGEQGGAPPVAGGDASGGGGRPDGPR